MSDTPEDLCAHVWGWTALVFGGMLAAGSLCLYVVAEPSGVFNLYALGLLGGVIMEVGPALAATMGPLGIVAFISGATLLRLAGGRWGHTPPGECPPTDRQRGLGDGPRGPNGPALA